MCIRDRGSGDAEVVSGDFSRLLNEINTMQSVSAVSYTHLIKEYTQGDVRI